MTGAPVRPTGAVYPGLTVRDLAFVAGMLGLLILPAAAFLAGRATQRYDTLMASPAVCGDSLHPSGVHRAPLYRPRGPVPK